MTMQEVSELKCKENIFNKINNHFSASVIFLNTVLLAIFLLYFIFTPLLLVGILRVSLFKL